MTHSKYKAPAPCPAAGHCQTLDPQAEKECGPKCPVWSGRECGPAWGWRACTGLSLPPSEPQGHTRAQSSCHGVQSQFWLNQTTMIAGAGWFPILGLISLIPAPKMRMFCFPGDTPNLKLHPWEWNKAAALESSIWGSEQQAGAGLWVSAMGRDEHGTPVPKQGLELLLPALWAAPWDGLGHPSELAGPQQRLGDCVWPWGAPPACLLQPWAPGICASPAWQEHGRKWDEGRCEVWRCRCLWRCRDISSLLWAGTRNSMSSPEVGPLLPWGTAGGVSHPG